MTTDVRDAAAGPAPAAAPAPARAPTSAVPRVRARPMVPYYLLLGATLLLVVLGLVMVFSASSVLAYERYGASTAIAARQALWVLLGLPVLWVTSRLPVRAFRLLAYPMLVGAVALLCLVAVAGTEVRGNRNWLDVGGPFRLQPSELAKVALVVWGADLLTRKHRLLGEWKHLLVPVLPVGLVVICLVLLGGDLGTALVLGTVLAALFYVAGAPLRLFVGFAGLAAAAVGYFTATHPERLSRITAWLHPTVDPGDAGYQALHGKYALASGGWFGLGLGASREKWPGKLPDAHTDFIFAVIGEELGLLGTVAVLVLFAVVAWCGVRIALTSRDRFVRLAAGGVTAWLVVQALVNIGAVLGLLPITGVPLPLVSYGGSSLVPTLIALGMLLSFARRLPGAARR